MKLSLSGILFDNYKSCEITMEEFAELAVDCGYDGVELRRTQVSPCSTSAEIERIHRILDEHGLYVTCLTARGMPREGNARDVFFDEYLGLCEKLNCSLLKINSDGEWIRHAAENAARRGIVLAANNHINSRFEKVAETLEFFRAVDHPNFRLLYDPMHLSVAGEDYLAMLDSLGNAVCNVLVQCVRPACEGEQALFSFRDRGFVKTPINDRALQDWSAILSKCRTIGYDGPITVIEHSWPPEHRYDIARRTAEYLTLSWEGDYGL